MNRMNAWKLAEGSVEELHSEFPKPLESLAAAEVAALVIRGAYPASKCERLVQRLIDQQLLYDPALPVPEKFLEDAIPEGYYREGRSGAGRQAWQAKTAAGRRRIDIGASLGYRGSDPKDFFEHSSEAHRLFGQLFADGDNPIKLLYQSLESLAVGKRVVTAHEGDGRQYSPAIIRAHYGGYTYAPHFDSVRLREKRENYAVHAFEHQFAGVLVLQNTTLGDQSAQCVLHRCLWQPEIDDVLRKKQFQDYAAANEIESVEVVLEPGDLYFFNTRCIHEVPGVAGELPLIVLATFIGFSIDRDEIFVWS